MPSSTRATSSRPCSKAGSRACETAGGSSTTTARASMPSSAKVFGRATRRCSALSAGTWSSSNTARCCSRRSASPGGGGLRAWSDNCPNQLYSALVFQGGAAWRRRLNDEIGDQGDVTRLIERRSDDELTRLMTNLAGHDLPSLLEAFGQVDHDRPICFICYTIKGFG